MAHFALASEHIAFFHKEHFIEFEGLLSPKAAEEIDTSVQALLAKRLKIPLSSLAFKTPFELFMVGRNLWKEIPPLKKALFRHPLHQIAATLFKKRILRMAFDQVICTTRLTDSFLTPPLTLAQMSGFKPVFGGLILRLTPDPSSESSLPSFIPQKVGHGVFVSPDYPLDFELLLKSPNQSFLLIAYCAEKTVYVLEKADPHVHALKKEGYAFGDLLKNETHPILYR